MKASGTVQNITFYNYLKKSGVKKYSVGGCGEKIQREWLWSQHP